MKIALIANSRARGVLQNKLRPDLEKEFSVHNISYDLLGAQYHNHATELVKQIPMRE